VHGRKRIVFFTRRWVLRRFAGALAELERRGHEVVIAFASGQQRSLPRELRLPGVRKASYDAVSDAGAGRAAALLRHSRDYLWYLAPEQAVGSHNRRRALAFLVRSAFDGRTDVDPTWPDPVVNLGEDDRTALEEALALLEHRLPADPAVVEFLREQRPDVVLVSPLVHQRLHQTEVVKAAREIGIPSGFLVYSLDNLSNKGRVHVAPDRTFVWNEAQRREAADLHGIDPESVVITGAAWWDEFLDLKPSADRDEFCRRHGFDPSRPIVLYLASTAGICPDEGSVVNRWLDTVRAAPPPLGDANLLIRPHPGKKHGSSWTNWQTSHERVSLVEKPRPADQGLFDNLYHAAAVVALNTSAEIEASMLEKPIYTFSAGELAPGQQGSRHFYYLLEGHGGVVTYSETLDDHVDQLGRGVAGDYDRAAVRRFGESWVRPRGFDLPVVPILADEILKLAGSTANARALLRRTRLLLDRRTPRAQLGRLRSLLGTR
jgi:hypothetical protein